MSSHANNHERYAIPNADILFEDVWAEESRVLACPACGREANPVTLRCPRCDEPLEVCIGSCSSCISPRCVGSPQGDRG